eukprot:14684-Heterococcus_DN1.PRE.5
MTQCNCAAERSCAATTRVYSSIAPIAKAQFDSAGTKTLKKIGPRLMLEHSATVVLKSVHAALLAAMPMLPQAHRILRASITAERCRLVNLTATYHH